MPRPRKKDELSEFEIVHVGNVNGDDYRTVQSAKIPITVLVRDFFKQRADEIRKQNSK